MTKEEMCAGRHISAYYNQSKSQKKADFSEACRGCELGEECKCSWFDMLHKFELNINFGEK